MKPALPLLCTALLILTQMYCHTQQLAELRKISRQFESSHPLGFTPTPLQALIERAVK